MKLDDLKQAWQEEVKVLENQPNIADAIDAIQSETQKLDRSIKFRDITESLIALALVPIWIYHMFSYGHLIELAGLVVLTLSCLYIPFKLHQARQPKANKLTSVKAFLQLEKTKVEAQVKLLGSVASWYLIPLFVGIVLVRLGANFDVDGHFVVDSMITHYLPLVVVFFALIYFANKHAVRKKFMPVLEKINQRLSELEQNSQA